MGPPRRKLQATVEETLTPPDSLCESQTLARILAAKGKNLYEVETPSGETLLVELEAKFRSTIWLKRGGYVLVDTGTLATRENKIDGEIVNVVRDEKAWRKAPFWPKEFSKKSAVVSVDSDEEQSNMGKMPPSDDELGN
jgi:probable RNA-binding protein EIF1AD